jgi:hypothetical protein
MISQLERRMTVLEDLVLAVADLVRQESAPNHSIYGRTVIRQTITRLADQIAEERKQREFSLDGGKP